MCLYLASEHPLTGFFDADLFVEDLIAKRKQFCSRFMVSCLLYLAAVRNVQPLTVFSSADVRTSMLTIISIPSSRRINSEGRLRKYGISDSSNLTFQRLSER